MSNLVSDFGNQILAFIRTHNSFNHQSLAVTFIVRQLQGFDD